MLHCVNNGLEGTSGNVIYTVVYLGLSIVHNYSKSRVISNLLLAECKVRMASYGPSFFLPFMAQVRSARAMKTIKEGKNGDP